MIQVQILDEGHDVRSRSAASTSASSSEPTNFAADLPTMIEANNPNLTSWEHILDLQAVSEMGSLDGLCGEPTHV